MRDKLGKFVKGSTERLGVKLSEETKEKIRKAHIGKKASKETKRKMSMARMGKKNHQYGKHWMKGKNNPNWKGGKHIDKSVYILIHNPNHPFCNNRGYVREHRLVMEKHLGRYLTKKEVVHHINKNPFDNRIENLMLFRNHSKHSKFHKKLSID